MIIFSHKLHKFHFFILPQTSFSPTDCTDNTDLFFLIFRYAQDFVLLRYQNLTYNKIRSLTASNALYGFAQIFALRHLFFLDMKTRVHDLVLRRLFSLTECMEFLYLTDVIFIFQGWYEWYRFLSDSVLFLWVDLIF